MRRERATAYAIGFGTGILLDLIIIGTCTALILGVVDIVSFLR